MGCERRRACAGPSPAPARLPRCAAPHQHRPRPGSGPRPTPTRSFEGSVQWMSLINVTASGAPSRRPAAAAGLRRERGLSGEINGSGTLECAASDSSALRFVGLGSGGIGTGRSGYHFAIRLQSASPRFASRGLQNRDQFQRRRRSRSRCERAGPSPTRRTAPCSTRAEAGGYAVRVHAVFFDMNGARLEMSDQRRVGGSLDACCNPGADRLGRTLRAASSGGFAPKRRRPSSF